MAEDRPGYRGLLSQPIRDEQHRWDRYARNRAEAKKHEQLEARIEALFAHYRIDRASEDAWRGLALALAFEHIAGFGTQAEGGRPEFWSNTSYGVLYRHYLRTKRSIQAKTRKFRRNRRLTDTLIVDRLLEDKSFLKDFPNLATKSQKTLKNQISTAKTQRAKALDARRQLNQISLQLQRLDLPKSGGPVDGGAGDWPTGNSPFYRKYGKKPPGN